MITFEDVSKQFGNGHLALDRVNLAIEPGEFAFVVGPSGAGKTTLLKLITRELLPTSGVVVVGGWNVVSLPTAKIPHLRRRVATVYQDFRLLPDRTVWENVALSLQVLGKQQDEIDREVEQVLGMVGLVEKAQVFPAQLSGGESQKTVIARTLVAKPEVILADEPTGNLDPATSWAIMKLLEDVNSQGTTIIMATHNAEVVNALGKRVVRLEQGKIASDQKKGTYVHAE